MIEWFLTQYEDPANGVPFDGAEGGYQYIAGGPYDVASELAAKFPETSQNVLEEAVAVLEDECGTEWVKIGQY